MVKGSKNELFLKLKERVDALTGNTELKKDEVMEQSKERDSGNSFVQLITSLQNESESHKNETSILIESKEKVIKSTIPIFHNPKELVNLLKKFSINGSPLKYTTHSWDAGRDANMFKDLAEFLTLAQNQYNKFSFELKSLSKNLNGKVYHFLFNKDVSKKGWGDINPSKRIYFGWSSPELHEACRLDSSLNPEDYILPAKYQIQRAGKTLQKFKHIIDVFKNEIEIRDEDPVLLNLILQKHDKFLSDFADPIIANVDDKTFYTDVQWLGKALDMIFENIQSRSQHRQVSYSLIDERDDTFVLEILHLDSFNTGKSIYDEKLRLVKGNFGDITIYLKNLCDWSIESQFAEGYYRINYLTSDPKTKSYQKLETADGFKHILTFYK
jgi:RNA-directed DNA polymerase